MEDDLAVTVNLPQIGYGYNLYTQKTDKVEILSSSNDIYDQCWVRPLPPENFKKKRYTEKIRQLKDKSYFDEELESYRQQEWHRRKYGVWVMINGETVYITGLHYFYLTHWRIDKGYPKYRLPDRQYFYFMDYVLEDPYSAGMVEVEKRRQGKTYRSGVFLFDRITRGKELHGGIQSKTSTDAKKNVFKKAVVQPFRKLPHFFMPEYDKSMGPTPTTELRFFKTYVKGRNVDYDYDPDAELESWIDCESSKPEAYDGTRLDAYVRDECFKGEVDPLDSHETVFPCLIDDEDNIIGKALYTSTVEDMGDMMNESAVELWKQSDFYKRTENGRTESGLYRFFLPAYKCTRIDKYGNPDEEKAREFYERERRSKKSSRSLSNYIRKFPFTWKEAFRIDNESSVYDNLKLQERDDVLKWKDNVFERYSLTWENGVRDTKVIPKKSKDGRFMVAWMPEEYKLNKCRRVGGKILPNKDAMLEYAIGIDPYDHHKPKRGRGSMAAAAVYRKQMPDDDLFSENFVILYVGRPPKAPIFYEDMVKLCHWLGAQMLFESQKQGIRQYFEDRGREHFMVKYDGKEYGIPASTPTLISLMEATEIFIEDRSQVLMFSKMSDDWQMFDPSDTEKFDVAMASGYALLHANRMKRKAGLIKKRSIRLDDYIRKYKTGGKTSRIKYNKAA